MAKFIRLLCQAALTAAVVYENEKQDFFKFFLSDECDSSITHAVQNLEKNLVLSGLLSKQQDIFGEATDCSATQIPFIILLNILDGGTAVNEVPDPLANSKVRWVRYFDTTRFKRVAGMSTPRTENTFSSSDVDDKVSDKLIIFLEGTAWATQRNLIVLLKLDGGYLQTRAVIDIQNSVPMMPYSLESKSKAGSDDFLLYWTTDRYHSFTDSEKHKVFKAIMPHSVSTDLVELMVWNAKVTPDLPSKGTPCITLMKDTIYTGGSIEQQSDGREIPKLTLFNQDLKQQGEALFFSADSFDFAARIDDLDSTNSDYPSAVVFALIVKRDKTTFERLLTTAFYLVRVNHQDTEIGTTKLFKLLLGASGFPFKLHWSMDGSSSYLNFHVQTTSSESFSEGMVENYDEISVFRSSTLFESEDPGSLISGTSIKYFNSNCTSSLQCELDLAIIPSPSRKSSRILVGSNFKYNVDTGQQLSIRQPVFQIFQEKPTASSSTEVAQSASITTPDMISNSGDQSSSGVILDSTEGPDPGQHVFRFSMAETYYDVAAEPYDSLLASTFYNVHMVEDSNEPTFLTYFAPKNTTTATFKFGIRMTVIKYDENIASFQEVGDATADELSPYSLTGDYLKWKVQRDPQIASKLTYHFVSSTLQASFRPPVDDLTAYHTTSVQFSTYPTCDDTTPSTYDKGPAFDSSDSTYKIYYLEGQTPSLSIKAKLFYPQALSANCFMYFENIYSSPSKDAYVGGQFELTGGKIGDAVNIQFTDKGIDEQIIIRHALSNQDGSVHSDLTDSEPVQAIKTTCAAGTFAISDTTSIGQQLNGQSSVSFNLADSTTSVVVFENACDPSYSIILLEGSASAFSISNAVLILNPGSSSQGLNIAKAKVQFPAAHQGPLFEQMFTLAIQDPAVTPSISGNYVVTIKSNHGMQTLGRSASYEAKIQGFESCPPTKFGLEEASDDFSLTLESPALLTIDEYLGDIVVDTNHDKFMSQSEEAYSFKISLQMPAGVLKLPSLINIDYCWDADLTVEWTNYNTASPYVMARIGSGDHTITISDSFTVTSNSSVCKGEEFEAFTDANYENKLVAGSTSLSKTKQSDHSLLVVLVLSLNDPYGETFYFRMKKSKAMGYLNLQPMSYFVCGSESLQWKSDSLPLIQIQVPWVASATGVQKFTLSSYVDELELADPDKAGCGSKETNPILPDLLQLYPKAQNPQGSNASATEIFEGGKQVVNLFTTGEIGVDLGRISSSGSTFELAIGFYTFYGMQYAFKPFEFTACEAKLEIIKPLSFFFQGGEFIYEVPNFFADYFKAQEDCPLDSWDAEALNQDESLVLGVMLPNSYSSTLRIMPFSIIGNTDKFLLRTKLPTGGVIGESELIIRVCPEISLVQDPLEMRIDEAQIASGGDLNLSAIYNILEPDTVEEYSYCTFKEATVVMDAEGGLPNDSSFLAKGLSYDGTWLKLVAKEAKQSATYSFFIKAIDHYGGESYRPATLKIEITEVTNLLPRFDGELQTQFTVQFNSQGLALQDDILYYESPAIIDPDGDSFEVLIDYEASLKPALEVRYEAKSSSIIFEIDSNQIEVPEQLGSHVITTKLIDSTQPYFKVTMQFTLLIMQESDEEENTQSNEDIGEDTLDGQDGQEGGQSNETVSSSLGNLLEKEPNSQIDPKELTSEEIEEILEIEGFEDLSEESKDVLASMVPELLPGMTIKELFDWLRDLIARRRAIEAAKTAELARPKVTISSFKEGRSVIFLFSKPLVVPKNRAFINYSNLFSISSKSVIDRSVYDPLSKKNSRRLASSGSEPDFPAEDSASEIAFSWSIEDHTSTRIKILLDFDKPELVSSTMFGRDMLELKIIDTGPFIAADTGEALSMADFGFSSSAAAIDIEIPPLLSEDERLMIESSVQSVGSVVNSVSFGNFLMGLLTSGSMQHLWGLIRAIQLIVLTALMEIVFPANAAEFYKVAILFANMDPLSGEKLYAKIFSFKPTPPLSAKFEDMDYSDLTFFNNSGSVFIILVLILLEPVGRVLMTAIALLCRRRKCCRQVGIFFHKKEKLALAKEGLLRLFMESYFEVCLCACLNLVSFLSGAELKEHFATFDDCLNSSLALLFLVFIFAFLAWAFFIIRKNFGQDPQANPTLDLFTDEFDQSSLFRALYQPIFMARRLLLVMILVFMRHTVFFQCMFVAHLSFLNLIYLTYFKPFKSQKSNKFEAFNEFTVFLSSSIILTFLNAGSGAQFREFIGWLLIGVACFNIGVNLISTGYETFKELYLTGRGAYQERLKALEAKSAFENLKVPLSKLEEIKAEVAARQFCREWDKHREWLLYHRVSLKEFSQEGKFQNLKAELSKQPSPDLSPKPERQAVEAKLKPSQSTKKKQRLLQALKREDTHETELKRPLSLIKESLEQSFEDESICMNFAEPRTEGNDFPLGQDERAPVPVFKGKGSLKSVVQALFEIDGFVNEVVRLDPVEDLVLEQVEEQFREIMPICELKKIFSLATDETPFSQLNQAPAISVNSLNRALAQEQGPTNSPRAHLRALLQSVDSQFPPIGEDTFGFRYARRPYCPFGSQRCSKIIDHNCMILELEVEHSIAESFAAFFKTRRASCKGCGRANTREKFIITQYPKSFIIAPLMLKSSQIVLSPFLETTNRKYTLKSAVVQTKKAQYGCLIFKEGSWILVNRSKATYIPAQQGQGYRPVLVFYS